MNLRESWSLGKRLGEKLADVLAGWWDFGFYATGMLLVFYGFDLTWLQFFGVMLLVLFLKPRAVPPVKDEFLEMLKRNAGLH